nr:TIGR04255 family protein [Spirochaetia bacterium]
YINFFKNETNIFDSFKLEINFSEKDSYKVEHTAYNTTMIVDNIKLNLKIQDKTKTNQAEEGLLVDIDSFSLGTNIDNLETVVNNLHLEEKKLFFNLLEDDFLKKFKPEYGEP